MSQTLPQWLLYAISSGACAALNGVFAKLTTTQLTTTYATHISRALGQHEVNMYSELVVRGLFLVMNIVFNGVMWGLFTKALTLGSSTVRVSVINTSANFVCTAVLGAAVFGEELPGLWWVGAGLLVAGSVIIGRREEGSQDSEQKGKDTTEAKPSETKGGQSSSSGHDEAGTRRSPRLRKPK